MMLIELFILICMILLILPWIIKMLRLMMEYHGERKKFKGKELLFPSWWKLSQKERHEEFGRHTCSNCGKKYIGGCDTLDIVHNIERPENLTETWGFCPHCGNDEMKGYTPKSFARF